MKGKFLILLVGIVLLISSVSAWTVDSPSHNGTVDFFADGTGHLNADGHTINFQWTQTGERDYEARYWFYSVGFTLNPDGTITSPQFPGDRLVR